MDISKSGEKNNPMYFVNPLIKDKVDETSTYEEGCLSVPNFFAEVNRQKECNVEYLAYVFQDFYELFHHYNQLYRYHILLDNFFLI